MKRRNFIKTSLAVGALPDVLSRLSAQPVPSGKTSFALPSQVAPGRHLFFLPERIAALGTRIAADASTQARWKSFLQQADNLAAGTRQRGEVKPGQTGMMLGLAWRITGDQRYANKLRESLLKSAEVKPKASLGTDANVPPWHSSLGTAGLVVNCAVGREALEGFLSPAERQQVTDGMMKMGVEPILEDWIWPKNRIHALDSMGHNWWSVCVSGAGVGVLAMLGEEPRAMDWLDAIETSLAGFFDYQGMILLNKTTNFDPAGAFYESVHYAGYALESYLTFRLARTNILATPPQRIAVLERIAEFFIQTLYPAATGDLAVDFGDSSLKPDAASTMRLLAALGFSPELTRWYLRRQDPEASDPLSLLYLENHSVTANNSVPASVVYPAIGWAILRNSWDNDATLLGIKSGFTWNHAHADAGSFVLYHAGQPLLIDSGKCDYSRKEYLGYYCQSHAHNVVLFNGQGQPPEDFHVRGVKFPGRVHDLLDGMGVKYVYADATGPMARHFSRNYRNWLWVDGVILVFDDILAHEPGKLDWLVHHAGEAGGNGAVVELSNGSARASLIMLHPADPARGEETGLAADAPDQKTTYLKLSTPTSTREQKFIVAIVPHTEGDSASLPKVELLREPNALGARISAQGRITDAYLNLQSDGRRMHVDSNNTINGWETDAYLLALTRPAPAASDIENVTRYFVAGCSYLRRDGQTALDSFSKVTGIIQPGKNIEVLLHGQPRIDIAILGLQKPSALRVNNQPTPFKHDADQRTLRFHCETA